MHFGRCVPLSGLVESLLKRASLVTISIERDIAVSVLKFVRMAVAMSDMDADDHAAAILGSWRLSAVMKLFDTKVDVRGIIADKGEQSLVASAGEVEHGLLAIDFHFPRVFKSFVEGAAKCVGGRGGGDDKMACVMGTG
jgi:hypothetical protein